MKVIIDVSEELIAFLHNSDIANNSINWNAYTHMALAIMKGTPIVFAQDKQVLNKLKEEN